MERYDQLVRVAAMARPWSTAVWESTLSTAALGVPRAACSVCEAAGVTTILPDWHVGPCPEQAAHQQAQSAHHKRYAAVRALALVTRDTEQWDDPDGPTWAIYRPAQPSRRGTSVEAVLSRLSTLETLIGLPTDTEPPASATAHLDQRGSAHLDLRALTLLRRAVRKAGLDPDDPDDREAIAALVPIAMARAAKARAAQRGTQPDIVTIDGQAHQLPAPISGPGSDRMMADLRALGRPVAGRAASDDAVLHAGARRAVKRASDTLRPVVRAGRVTSGSELCPQWTSAIVAAGDGGDSGGKRSLSGPVTLIHADGTSETVGKTTGRPRKRRQSPAELALLADALLLGVPAEDVLTAADLAELAELSGKRGGAASTRRAAILRRAARRVAGMSRAARRRLPESATGTH